MKSKDFTGFLQEFYDQGFLREVYRSEKAIVCNVYNQFYIALDRQFLEKRGEKYSRNIPCFTMNSHGLKAIVEDDSYVTRYYRYLSKEDQSRVLMWLDERLFRSWERRDPQLKQKSPQNNMDLAFEASLLKKGPEAMRAQLLKGKSPISAEPLI